MCVKSAFGGKHQVKLYIYTVGIASVWKVTSFLSSVIIFPLGFVDLGRNRIVDKVSMLGQS